MQRKSHHLAKRAAALLAAMAVSVTMIVTPGAAEDCSKSAFQKVVDDTGASLRRLHAESQTRVQAGFRRLKEQRGWTEAEYVDRANELLMDERTETFDTRASELLAKLDRGAEDSQGADACAKLADLQATALELQATVRAKTGYMLKRLEESTVAAAAPADGKGAPAAAPAPTQPAPTAKSASVEPRPTPIAPAPSQVAPPAEKASPAPKAIAPPAPKAEAKTQPQPKAAPAAPAPWSTKTTEVPLAAPPAAVTSSAGSATTTSGDAASARPAAPAMPPVGTTDGFSEEDIREASRGFFGGISSGLASVIEHSFSKLGRPSGYVLGNEGGGAFIAGLRYGSGKLFTRGGEQREVYWHGPSIGYDIGAAGSKTMFLVYNLNTPIDIFSGFSGVDGSAYLVGGVGMTLLTDGKIVMAPIRSGIGVRLGASIGYIRFTARPTWNPF